MKRIKKNGSGSMAKFKYRLVSDHTGTTIVELLVAFALIGILLVGASQVITSGTSTYYYMKGVSYGCQVSDTIMDKVCGHIESAWAWASGSGQLENDKSGSTGSLTDPDNEEPTMILSGSKISFYDHTGSPVSIYYDTDSSKVVIHYDAVTTGSGDDVVTRYDAVDWMFDDKVLMGYNVTSLKFSLANNEPENEDDYENNVIKVELSIHSDRYGDYDSVRYVRCYNFDNETYGKIQEVPETASGE